MNAQLADEDGLENEEDTLKDKYLTFHIGKEDYGIEIRHVTEIIGIQKITSVPDARDYIRGVINLRGKVIPIMDIRIRFGMESREYDERTCVIVVNINQASIGLVVDTVSEVINIPEDDIEAAMMGKGRDGTSYIMGMGKVEEQIKIILDVERLLFDGNLDISHSPQPLPSASIS